MIKQNAGMSEWTLEEKRKIIKYMVFMRGRGYNYAIAYGEIKSPRLLFVKTEEQARRLVRSIYGSTYRSLHDLPNQI